MRLSVGRKSKDYKSNRTNGDKLLFVLCILLFLIQAYQGQLSMNNFMNVKDARDTRFIRI